MSRSALDPAAVLPHGPAARLVSRVVERGSDSVVCEGGLPSGSPYERDGRCPTFVLLELAAQAAALLEASAETDPHDARARAGYLVRAKNIRCARTEFETARPLVAWARSTGAVAPLFTYEFVVSDAAGELLRGELSILTGTD